MIPPAILPRVRNGVCAIGYLTVPLADYIRYHELPGMFEVVGTGFPVRASLVAGREHACRLTRRSAQTLG